MTLEEDETALKKIKILRTGADDALVADLLKTRHEGMMRVIASLFTEALN